MSRVVVHLSDLHFGRLDHETLQPLIDCVRTMKPHLVVVSGDLTQRARILEFEQAAEFLQKLPQPQLVIPGNHDVPLFDLYGRFVQQFALYRKYIHHELEPAFVDDEIAAVGLHTARSLTWKGGRINHMQILRIREKLLELGPHHTRIIVTHHPFDLPQGHTEFDLVGRARMAMEHLAECGADLLLSGHLHISQTSNSSLRYRIQGHGAVVVQAGTATSTRSRGEENSFNCLRIDNRRVAVERWAWNVQSQAFWLRRTELYKKGDEGWNAAKITGSE